MIKQFKKLLVLFLLIGTHLLVYSQGIPNLNLSLNSADLQGRCAPINILVGVNWPEDNNPSTEYIFILHDEGNSDPVSSSIYETQSFFHSDSLPESIEFFFPTSSCNASNASYAIDCYIKDTLASFPYNSEGGENVSGTGGFSVYGELIADFSSQLDESSCGIYTLINGSILGESLSEENLCAEAPVTSFEWSIDSDPSNFSVIDGNLGDGPNPASDTLIIQFQPGIHNITISSNNFQCFDSFSSQICIEEYDFDINDLNINLPDKVCVGDLITIENDINEINYACISSNDNWFDWSINQVELICTYDDDSVVNGQAILPSLSGSNPKFSIPNPGLYEIIFESNHPCINPPIRFSDTIIVQGYPVADTSSFVLNQNCDLSANLSIDIDTCNSEPPYFFDWVPQESVTYDDESIDSVNLIFESSGIYTLEYIIRSDNESCGVDTAYFDVYISDRLNLEIGSDTSICQGGDLIINPAITSGEMPYDYLWEYGGEESTFSQLNLSNLENDVQVILEVNDSGVPSCSISDTLNITISPIPSYTLDPLFIKCEDTPIFISFEEGIQSGDAVLWNSINESNFLEYVQDKDSLIYVSVTSEDGCTFYDSTQVQISSINQDFENFPDTIVFCSLVEHFLIDTINHPTILDDGFWSGDNIIFSGVQGDNRFLAEEYGSFIVFYSKQNQFGCQITDSVIVEVSDPPSSEFVTDNDQFACVPSESFIAFNQSTLENPINTSYTFEVFAGSDQIDTTISFNQSTITDSLFFNLKVPSCNFAYEDSVNDSAYLIKLEADNVCKQNEVYFKSKIHTSSQRIADFTFDHPNSCFIDIEYDFINITPDGYNISTGSCSPATIQWQISGNENIDWLIDSLSLEADTFEVTFFNIGSYDVTMISSNSCGADTITKNVLIEESPLAYIEVIDSFFDTISPYLQILDSNAFLLDNGLSLFDSTFHDSTYLAVSDPIFDLFDISAVSSDSILVLNSFYVDTIDYEVCSPSSAEIFLKDSTYLNPDTTSYLISIYAGEDNLVGTKSYTQSSLPSQNESVILDLISSSSCGFTYNDTLFNGAYKLKVEAINICGLVTSDSIMIYYAESALPQFSIDSANLCSNDWYLFSDSTNLSQSNFDNCSSEPFTYWELSGIEDVDWELDPSGQLGDSLNAGSDNISIRFLKSDVYSVSLISKTCSIDTITELVCAQTNLDFIAEEELIFFDDTACLNTPFNISDSISDAQACGMEFSWSINSNEIICDLNDYFFDTISPYLQIIDSTTVFLFDTTLLDSTYLSITDPLFNLFDVSSVSSDSILVLDSFYIDTVDVDFNLTSAFDQNPVITFFKPGDYQVTCKISNSCDTLVVSKSVKVLKLPESEYISSEVNYTSVCDSNEISISLDLDSCVEELYNTAWNISNDYSLISMSDTSINLVFSNYEDNSVQYTIENYCAAHSSTYVHDFVPIIESFGPDSNLCFNPEYNFELDNDSTNGSWSLNSELLPMDSLGIYYFTPNEIGISTLIYTYYDSDSCEKSKSFNINVQESPQFDTLSIQECVGVEAPFYISLTDTLYNLVSGLNFFWTDSQLETNIFPSPDENPVSGVISANSIGNYTSYFYFEYESCYRSDSMTFIADGADFSVVGDSILCEGDTTELSFDIVTSDNPITVAWLPTGEVSYDIDVNPDETTTYLCEITDANDCVTSDSLVLNVLCTNASLSDFIPIVVENQTQTLFPSNQEFENVLYEGCTGANITFYRPECLDLSDEIGITYKISKYVGNDTIALGSNFESDEDFYLNPPLENSKIIIPSDSSSVTLNIFTFNDFIPEISDTLIFVINGIEYSDCFKTQDSLISFVIKDQPDFDLNITADSYSTYCPGDEVIIEVFPSGGVGADMIDQESTSDIAPYTYEWQWPYVGSSATRVMNPYDTTIYRVQVTDVCGYVDTTSVEIFVNQYDSLLVSANTTHVCEDTLAQICVSVEGGEGNYTYLWSNEASTECIEVFYSTDPYIVSVTDGCGTQVLADGYVYNGIPEPPYFEYLPIPHIEFGIEFYNYTPSLYGHTYLWSFDDSIGSDHYHPIHVYPGEGSYNVTLTVSDSIYQDCKSEYSSYVNVHSNFKLWVPNSFTPNNDGINDFFKPVVIGVDYYELIITDRWGEVVFTTSDVNESWDGYANGLLSPSGGYKCEVKYSKFDDIMKLSHYVNINLIR